MHINYKGLFNQLFSRSQSYRSVLSVSLTAMQCVNYHVIYREIIGAKYQELVFSESKLLQSAMMIHFKICFCSSFCWYDSRYSFTIKYIAINSSKLDIMLMCFDVFRSKVTTHELCELSCLLDVNYHHFSIEAIEVSFLHLSSRVETYLGACTYVIRSMVHILSCH